VEANDERHEHKRVAYHAPYELPTPDPALTDRVGELVRGLLQTSGEDAAGTTRRPPLHDSVGFLETLLGDDPSSVNALALAQLIASLQTEGDVDRTVLQIAFAARWPSARGRTP